MECLIHCTGSEEKLAKSNSLLSWETLVNAARIRKFEAILKILEETEPDIFPDIWYHRKCRSIFIMEKDPQRTEKEKQAADCGGTSSQLTPRRSITSPTNELLLSKKYLIRSFERN